MNHVINRNNVYPVKNYTHIPKIGTLNERKTMYNVINRNNITSFIILKSD